MRMVKIGEDRIDANQLRDYFPDQKGKAWVIDLTYSSGKGTYLTFSTQHERDAALEKLDTFLGVIGLHNQA